VINKGIKLLYIFILKEVFEFKFQSGFGDFINSVEFAMNFRSLQIFEFDSN
jgi:hypothetical protein